MFHFRKQIATIVAVTVLGTAAAAQTQSQPAPKSAPSSKMEDISKWTQQQWDAAKAEWSNQTTKYGRVALPTTGIAGCAVSVPRECRAAEQRALPGLEGSQFLYDCMMKSD
jgi:hypothetical protein